MTKHILHLTLICFCITTSYAQNFEGKITYQNSYTSKIPNIPDQQFNTMMGTSQEFLIKDGDYKSSMNGTFLQWQLYINQDNKLYTKMSNSDVVFYHDGNVNIDEVIGTEINKGVMQVLGYLCDEVILTTKSGIQKFYFNPAIKIDASLFKNHKFGNWAELLSKINSLPLKMSIETPQFTMESVALKVEPQQLDRSFFALPPESKLQKSPF